MRYTKIALLTFGAGLMLGFAVVVTATEALARLASGLMALGLLAIPPAMAADWRRATKTVQKNASEKRANTPIRRRASAPAPSRRPRKIARPKR